MVFTIEDCQTKEQLDALTKAMNMTGDYAQISPLTSGILQASWDAPAWQECKTYADILAISPLTAASNKYVPTTDFLNDYIISPQSTLKGLTTGAGGGGGSLSVDNYAIGGGGGSHSVSLGQIAQYTASSDAAKLAELTKELAILKAENLKLLDRIEDLREDILYVADGLLGLNVDPDVSSAEDLLDKVIDHHEVQECTEQTTTVMKIIDLTGWVGSKAPEGKVVKPWNGFKING